MSRASIQCIMMMRLANAGSRVCNQEEATYLMSQSLELRSTKTPFILHQVKFTSHFRLLYGQSRNSKDSLQKQGSSNNADSCIDVSQ